MSELKRPTDLNNTPNVTEQVASSAPQKALKKLHRRGCPHTAKGIVKEWWWIRITAAALVPLSVWLVVSLANNLLAAGPDEITLWLAHPLNLIGMVLFLMTGFVHARLGLHEIIVDYVHAPAKKRATILFADAASLALAVGSIAAVIHLYQMA